MLVHDRQRRHSPLHEHGERVVKRRSLPNGGDVPEGPDPQLLDLLADEGGLGDFLSLHTSEPQSGATAEKKTRKTSAERGRRVPFSYEYMEELEDPFVGQDVQDVPRLRVDDWQPVDLVFE